MSPISALLRTMIRAYRLVVKPVLPNSCRYTPSCSEYALDALARHGALSGTALLARRLFRCQPWGGFGYDPVPGDPMIERMRDVRP